MSLFPQTLGRQLLSHLRPQGLHDGLIDLGAHRSRSDDSVVHFTLSFDEDGGQVGEIVQCRRAP